MAHIFDLIGCCFVGDFTCEIIDSSYQLSSCLVSVQPVRELMVNLSVLLVKRAILGTDVNCKYILYCWYTRMSIKPSNQDPLSRFHIMIGQTETLRCHISFHQMTLLLFSG